LSDRKAPGVRAYLPLGYLLNESPYWIWVFVIILIVDRAAAGMAAVAAAAAALRAFWNSPFLGGGGPKTTNFWGPVTNNCGLLLVVAVSPPLSTLKCSFSNFCKAGRQAGGQAYEIDYKLKYRDQNMGLNNYSKNAQMGRVLLVKSGCRFLLLLALLPCFIIVQ
jgi:hypothetical protein